MLEYVVCRRAVNDSRPFVNNSTLFVNDARPFVNDFALFVNNSIFAVLLLF
jgi:hypothetical protein